MVIYKQTMTARYVKKVRKELGVSQREFGKMVGYHETMISRIERKELAVPRRLQLEIQGILEKEMR